MEKYVIKNNETGETVEYAGLRKVAIFLLRNCEKEENMSMYQELRGYFKFASVLTIEKFKIEKQ